MTILFIPALGIIVPAEERKNGTNGQDIIDKPDRAVMWSWGRLTVIADHCNQGFDRINRAVAGKTRAYVGARRFICDISEIGHIRTTDKGNRLFRADWTPVHEAWKDGLCIYTCIQRSAPDVMDVRLTHWREIT